MLGGVLQHGQRHGFGPLAAHASVAASRRARPEIVPEIEFTDSDDKVILRVFERLRDGFSVDRFLADPQLAIQFEEACRKLNLKAPGAAIARRLLAIRKRTGGGSLSPTTRFDRRPGLVDRFGPAVEFAMVKMRVRYGASVDDILSHVDIGFQFEEIASTILEGGDSVDYRLCALQIRKARHLDKKDQAVFEQTSSAEIFDRMESLGTLEQASEAPKTGRGHLILSEPNRPLYVCHSRNIGELTSRLNGRRFVEGVAKFNGFWKPDPAHIDIGVIWDDDLPDAGHRVWGMRLIADLHPPFNWPIHLSAA